MSRSSRRRNAFWEMRVATGPMVVYVWSQSTDSPTMLQRRWYSASMSSTTRSHSSTKLGREMRTGSFGSLPFSSGWGGVKSGSYGSDGSHRVAVSSWTRRSTLRPLSSHPIG